MVNTRDRRLDQCAQSSERHRPPYRRRSSRSPTGRRIGYDIAAPRQSAAGRRISGRRLSPRRRRSRRRRRTDQGQRIHEKALTVNGKTIGENCKGKFSWNRDVIKDYDKPIMKHAGFKMLKGNLFDSAIMKTCVISEEFRNRYLSNPKDPNAFEAKAIVFDGPEDYHANIDNPEAWHRREHHSLHARHRAAGLSGRRRSGQHAGAELTPREGRAIACLASAMAANRAPRARRRSSMPRRKRLPAAAWPSSRMATACASTSTRAPPTSCCRRTNWRSAAPP